MLIVELQKLLLTYKKQVTWVFLAYEVGLIGLWIGGVILFNSQPQNFFLLYNQGKQLGTISFFLYCVTLLPGIMMRLNVFPIVRTMLMSFRRHLGISMFLSAYAHMGLTTTIPLLFTGKMSLAILSTHQMMGFLAMLALFPLWLTSNDFSVKKLRGWWKWIHKLTYIALFFIFMHVALAKSLLAMIAIALIILEVISWIVVWQKKRSQAMGVVS